MTRGVLSKFTGLACQAVGVMAVGVHIVKRALQALKGCLELLQHDKDSRQNQFHPSQYCLPQFMIPNKDS